MTNCRTCGHPIAGEGACCQRCGKDVIREGEAAPDLFTRPGIVTLLAVLNLLRGCLILIVSFPFFLAGSESLRPVVSGVISGGPGLLHVVSGMVLFRRAAGDTLSVDAREALSRLKGEDDISCILAPRGRMKCGSTLTFEARSAARPGISMPTSSLSMEAMSHARRDQSVNPCSDERSRT